MSMATDFTDDAVVITDNVPPGQRANLDITSGPAGTIIQNERVVTGLRAQIAGPVTFQNGVFRNTSLTFLGPQPSAQTGIGQIASSTERAVLFRQTSLTSTTVEGSSQAESLTSGQSRSVTNTVRTTANMAGGDDSVSFLNNSRDRRSTYSMGDGSDSVVFGRGSSTSNTRVRLGEGDGQRDIVDVSRRSQVKRLVVTEFGREDTLRVGGRTYDYQDIQRQGGRIGENIRVKLD